MPRTDQWSTLDYLVHYAELSYRLQATPFPTMAALDKMSFATHAAREAEFGRQLFAWHEFWYIQQMTMNHVERAFEAAFGYPISAELSKASTSARQERAAGATHVLTH